MIYDENDHGPVLPRRWGWQDTTIVALLALFVVGFVAAALFIWESAAGEFH